MLEQFFSARGSVCGSLTEALANGTGAPVENGEVPPSTKHELNELNGGPGQSPSPVDDFQVALDKHLSSLRDVLGKHHEIEIATLRNKNSELRAALDRLETNQEISSSAVKVDVLDTNEPQDKSAAETSSAIPTLKSLTRADSVFEVHDALPEDSYSSRAAYTSARPSSQSFVAKDNNCFRHFVSHPFTGKRIFYDLMSMVVLAYDVITLPLEAAEILTVTTWYQVVGVFITAFWTIDCVLSFFQGYTYKGHVELRWRKTALAYLRSWFLFDCTLLMIDYVTMFLESVSSAFGLARSAKILRIGRIIRLLRLSRMVRVPKQFRLSKGLAMAVGTDFAESVERVFFWIAGLLFVNHFIACIWVFLGNNTSPGWAEFSKRAYKLKASKEASSWYLYTTSLHWSLTQFTPASMEVVPVNMYERVFTICTMFAALVFFSSFVSSITNEVASIRLKRRVQTTNSNNLVLFLKENYIPLDLGARIQEVAQMQQANQRRINRIHESDVELLKGLPISLLEELHLEVYLPTMSLNPFLDRLSELGFHAVTRLCHAAMRQQSLMAGQDMFSRGQDGTHMIFVIAGEVKYIQGITLSLRQVDSMQETATIQQEQYLCEQVLFLKWQHRGLLTAWMPCELATLEGATFHTTVQRFPEILAVCKKSALSYVDMLMANTEELTDLPMNKETMNALLDGAGFTKSCGARDFRESCTEQDLDIPHTLYSTASL